MRDWRPTERKNGVFYPKNGSPRLMFRDQLALARRVTELHDNRLSFERIAAELGISHTTARRLVHWLEDSTAVGALTRRKRLPMRWGRAWSQENFERLVAERQKMLALLKADEALKDAAEATRNAEKDEKAQAKDWLEKGGDPPAWIVEALIETIQPRKD